MTHSLALVGCGSMGSALLKGWLSLLDSEVHIKNFWIVTPHREKVEPFLNDSRVSWFSSPQDLPKTPDIIVFSVKPFILEDILPFYTSFESLFISVASGKPLDFYKKHLSTSLPIVRAMPNIPVSIHQGVIGLYTKDLLNPQQMTLLKACFQDLGFCLWVSSDEEIDKITALSASGPAYVYFMIESLAKVGEALGFHKEEAMALALNTFWGASTYAHNSNLSPDVLRQHVTSSKGTTSEALKVLETGELYTLIESAVMAAYKRARELAE